MSDLRIGVLTCSDECDKGDAEDLAGLAVVDACEQRGWLVVAYHVCCRDAECISTSLVEMCDVDDADVVLTLGGTGLGPRDVAPEATQRVCERMVPGIPELVRRAATGTAGDLVLSRAVAGVRGSSLVVNLPGGVEAALGGLDLIAPKLLEASRALR